KSIQITLAARLEKFNLSSVAALTATDELDLQSLGEKKMALFALIPDNDASFNFLVSLLYASTFQQLFYLADHKHNGSLPVPVHFVMDEFANVSLPSDFDKLLATMRSRNISVSIILQNIAQLKALFEKEGHAIAAVIVEPVAGNMGCVPPVPGFLETLRELTKAHGALLIFDEVMCGFRASSGGAQKKYNIKPDLTCLGKIVGGGLPMAVFGGSREIMSQVAPAGPIYQAGTLSGNPIAVTAGLATLSILQQDPTVFKRINQSTETLCQGLKELAAKHNVPVQVQYVGSMFTLFFSDKPVLNFDDASACDMEAFKKFFHYNLSHGIYYAPSQYESNFMSAQHSAKDIEHTLAVADEAFATL
ncbi:aminotransferase class III-fold pyridoxal phosphate-dependent enzyme, partial [uncultured Veillonella sp.]|uniref:aminotransferase class III-fold pyridoxal phosphate-dependent enzyme n=1 Tax=uncultured Veillonella sp. TaxID=159268 RepID=UPI0025DAA192